MLDEIGDSLLPFSDILDVDIDVMDIIFKDEDEDWTMEEEPELLPREVLDTIEYQTDEDWPEFLKGDAKKNNSFALSSQILCGAGIALMLASRVAYGDGWEGYVGMAVNAVAGAIYSVAVIKYQHAQDHPTRLTTFRSWKINFVAFWVYLVATMANIILTALPALTELFAVPVTGDTVLDFFKTTGV